MPTALEKYYGVTPENEKASTEGFLQSMQALPITAYALAAPPALLGQGYTGLKSLIPFQGAAGVIGSGLESLAELGVDKVAKPIVRWAQDTNPVVARVTPQVPDAPTVLPGHQTLQDMAESSVRGAFNTIPNVAPTSEAGRLGRDIGVGLGQAAFTAAPELAGPAFMRAALNAVSVPRSAIPIAGTIGGVASAIGPEGAALGQPPKLPDAIPIDQVYPTQAAKGVQIASADKSFAPQTTIPIDQVYPSAAPSIRPNYALPPGASSDNDSGTPYWKYGLGLAGAYGVAWAAAKYGPRKLNIVSDFLHSVPRDPLAVTAELNSPGYALRGRSAPAVEMPLPNDASGFTRRWTMRNQDPNAVLNSLAQAPEISPTAAAADARVSANKMINDPGNANRTLESTFRTGVDAGTGRTFPKMVDYKAKFDALTPAEKDLFHQAAWFKSEKNLRDQKIAEAAANGTRWTEATDPDYRVSFKDNPTDAPTGAQVGLKQVIDLAESNPKIKAVLDQNKAIQASIVDDWEARNQITKWQADYARKWYSDFMPTFDAEGNYLHSWDAKMRDVNSGYNTPPAAADQAMIKHFATSMQQGAFKDWQRDWVLHIEQQQKLNPSIGEIVTRRLKPDATPAQGSLDRSITIQTAEGPVTFDINNTALWHSLGGGKQQTAMASGIANAVRLTTQNATTGLLSTAFGAPFAVKTFIRDLRLIPAQLQPGAWRGSIDKAIDRRLPYDPTFISGSLKTAGQDVSSVVAKNFGDILANRNGAISAGLRKYFSDAQVDNWAHLMTTRYEASKLAYRESQGVGAGGNRQALNMNVLASDTAARIHDPTAGSVAPMLGREWASKIPKWVPLPNAVRGAAESAINLNTMAREIYGAFADAPHSYAHDINISNPRYTPQTLAAMIQDVTGNPGTMGTGKWAQRLSKNLPFYNTSIQALAAHGRAIRDHPIATGTTVATTLATLALAEHLSALLSGPQHVKFLEDKLSNDTQARNATFFHGPGTDPTNHTELPLDNESQFLWPYFSGLVGHAIGTWNAHDNEDTASRLIHTLAGMFQGHVTTDTVKQTGAGFVSGFVPVDVPPAISVPVAALTGQEVQNVPGRVMGNILSGQPTFGGLTRGGGQQQQGTPGQGAPDSALIGSDSGTLHAVMSSLGGAFGAAWDLAHNFNQRSRVGSDWAWQGLWNDYKQEWKDNTRWANSVWQNNLPQSTYGPMEERTANMWTNVNKAVTGVASLRGAGFAGSGHGVAPVLVTGESPVPPESNPMMRNLYMTMAEGGKAIQRDIMPREQAIRVQIKNLKEAPFQPDEKRRLGNQYSEQLYGVIAEKHRALLALNARLSQLAGGRHVDVGSNIDWKGTVDQFHY